MKEDRLYEFFPKAIAESDLKKVLILPQVNLPLDRLWTNVTQDLRLWHEFLKLQGKIGLCVFAGTAFVHQIKSQ